MQNICNIYKYDIFYEGEYITLKFTKETIVFCYFKITNNE